MATYNIVFLIDIQNGFAKDHLTAQQGGSLYVPGGEKVGAPAAHLIRSLSNATVILSQDYHPKNHISFASTHAGAAPFFNIQLQRGEDGRYAVAKDGVEGTLAQTLWLDHCVQGTESALFVDEIMGELPQALCTNLRLQNSAAVLSASDERHNHFHVVRKGTQSDLDSYGVATENDGVTTTLAPVLFKAVAEELSAQGMKDITISIGGLATNFCVEFSHNDIYKYLIPELQKLGMTTRVQFLTNISAGIPDDFAPKGFEVSSALQRMAEKGTTVATTDDVICQAAHPLVGGRPAGMHPQP